jgi:hypothetical protein
MAGLRLFLMTISSSIWMGETARGEEGRGGAVRSEPFWRKKSLSSSKDIEAIFHTNLPSTVRVAMALIDSQLASRRARRKKFGIGLAVGGQFGALNHQRSPDLCSPLRPPRRRGCHPDCVSDGNPSWQAKIRGLRTTM